MATSLESEKIRRLSTVPDDFLKRIPRSETELYDRVVELLSRFEIKNGAFAITNSNLKLAAEISDLLRRSLLATDYVKAVTEFASQFDKQRKINQELFAKAFPGEFTVSTIANNTVAIAKRNAIDMLLNSEADVKLIKPLRDTLEQAVINGSGYKETLTAIRQFIEGTEEVDGAMLRYSSRLAHDAFAISDASYTSLVSEELDAEWFKYAGDVIATSREFCEARHNEFFYYKEIESWGDLEWNGKIPGTNSSTIYSLRGGYGCRHSIIPVSIFAVPMEVIKRNIENGNFSPTEKESELLGL